MGARGAAVLADCMIVVLTYVKILDMDKFPDPRRIFRALVMCKHSRIIRILLGNGTATDHSVQYITC